MPVGWRLVSESHAVDAFRGEGASRVGGRFNSRGTPVVYAADSLSLAILEVLVHLPSYRAFGKRVAFRLTLPENLIELLDAGKLPPDWRISPPPRSTQHLGDEWVREGRSAVLHVPSVVAPHSYNVLLNPEHPDFSVIEIGEPEAVTLDPRLIKSR